MVDELVRVDIDKFISSFFIGNNSLFELGPNQQPINDQIIDGPSSYRPKLKPHENPREINTFLLIWTRTIFEFIYALACTIIKLQNWSHSKLNFFFWKLIISLDNFFSTVLSRCHTNIMTRSDHKQGCALELITLNLTR